MRARTHIAEQPESRSTSTIGAALLDRWTLCRFLRSPAVAVCACVCAFGCLAAPVQARLMRPQAVVDALVKAGAPGAIALVGDRRTGKVATAGVEVLGRAARPGTDDPFRVFSVTKSFTAAIVLQLVQEDRLRLSDRVQRWLPGLLPGPAGKITIEELLAHRSGLFNHQADPRFQANPYGTWQPRQLVALSAGHPLLFPPGSAFLYTSTNYVVLGLIVEAVTHHPFVVELRRRILRPLHLRHTTLVTDAGPSGRFLHGYTGSAEVSALNLSGGGAAAGRIVSNVSDLASFFRALLTGGIIHGRLLALMRSPISPDGVTTGGIGRGYGLGLTRYPVSCGFAWGHDGAGPGYLIFVRASRDGRRVVVLAISTGLLTAPLAGALIPAINDLYCRDTV